MTHSPLTHAQRHLAESHLELVRIVTRCAHRRLRTIAFEDLQSHAAEALVLAAQRFDPTLGVPFRAFALPRMQWWLMNGIEREFFSTVTFGREPEAERAAEPAGFSISYRSARRARIRANVRRGVGPTCGQADLTGRATEGSADDVLLQSETMLRLRASLESALATLPPSERALLARHYEDGLELKELAKAGVCSYATLRRRNQLVLDRIAAQLSENTAPVRLAA